MGLRNFLVEGVPGAGKTSVCMELRRRGYVGLNGDTELAYQGDPATGEPTDVPSHSHHLWRVTQVRDLVTDQSERYVFFCGGSRNTSKFIDLFDAVFVLDIDLDTLHQRLDLRPATCGRDRPPREDDRRRAPCRRAASSYRTWAGRAGSEARGLELKALTEGAAHGRRHPSH